MFNILNLAFRGNPGHNFCNNVRVYKIVKNVNL